MPFINTAGLTILGDGSQWFWSMAAFLALPITGYAIFSQLRAQRSANRVNAMAALMDKWESDRMVRHRMATLIHAAEGRPGWPTFAWRNRPASPSSMERTSPVGGRPATKTLGTSPAAWS